MRRRAPYTRRALKSSSAVTVLLGGETDYCAERFGYRRDNNGIKCAPAPQDYSADSIIHHVVFAEYLPHYDILLAVGRVGQVYQWRKTDEGVPTMNGLLSTTRPFMIPTLVNGNQYHYVVYGGQRMIKINSGDRPNLRPVTTRYRMPCGAWHYGRAFATVEEDRYLLCWTGFDVTDWEPVYKKGGQIRLDPDCGQILNIVDMGEKLAVVRERGLTIVNVLSDMTHMRLDCTVNRKLPPVTENSAVMCKGKLYVGTVDGLYVYDGEKTSRVNEGFKVEGYRIDDAATYGTDRIFFTYALDVEGFTYDKFLVEFDPATGEYTPFGKMCHNIFVMDNKFYCFRENKISLLSEKAEGERRWVSKRIDLGRQGAKTLKYLYIEGEGDATVKIDCDGRTRSVQGFGKKYIGECGRGFTFTVSGVCSVSRLSAEWEVR